MTFRFTQEGEDLVVYVSGALTFHQHTEGEQLVYQVTTLVDRGEVTLVRLNFAAVPRMDSHWLGILIRILRRVREKNARLVIEKPTRVVRHLFEMVEMERIAEIRA